MRFNRTMGVLADGNDDFPSCYDFAEYLDSSECNLADVQAALNGQLHGPVHVMIGGQWDFKYNWHAYMKMIFVQDNFLLLSKDLWRQGYIRVPDYCSMDTPHSDCMPR